MHIMLLDKTSLSLSTGKNVPGDIISDKLRVVFLLVLLLALLLLLVLALVLLLVLSCL